MADQVSSLSPYTYAGNNPASSNDPTGLETNDDNDELIRFLQGIFLEKNDGGGGSGGTWSRGSGYHYFENEEEAKQARNDYYNYNTDWWGYTLGGSAAETDRLMNDPDALARIGDAHWLPSVTAKAPPIEDWDPFGYGKQHGELDNSEYSYSTFNVLHSANDSFSWDWFLETTRSTNASESVVTNYYIQTSVIIIYNTNPKDWGTPKYGQVVDQIGRTRSLVMDASGFHSPGNLPYSPSTLMQEFIQGAKDYHCGGCLSDDTVEDKYWNFILSYPPKEGKLNAGSAKHY